MKKILMGSIKIISATIGLTANAGTCHNVDFHNESYRDMRIHAGELFSDKFSRGKSRLICVRDGDTAVVYGRWGLILNRKEFYIKNPGDVECTGFGRRFGCRFEPDKSLGTKTCNDITIRNESSYFVVPYLLGNDLRTKNMKPGRERKVCIPPMRVRFNAVNKASFQMNVNKKGTIVCKGFWKFSCAYV